MKTLKFPRQSGVSLATAALLMLGGPLTMGCPTKVPLGATSPGKALGVIMNAAQDGNGEAFAPRLSKEFHSLLESFRKIEAGNPSLRGSLSTQTIMSAQARTLIEPKRELVIGNTAVVTGIHRDRSKTSIKLVLEDGYWKLSPPPQLRQLTHSTGSTAPTPTSMPSAPQQDTADAVVADPASKNAAMVSYKDARSRETASALQDALRKNPNDKELIVALVKTFVALDDGSNALAVANTALRLHPAESSVHDAYALTKMLQKDYASASQHWEKAMTLATDPAEKQRIKEQLGTAKYLATPPESAQNPHGDDASAGGAASQPSN